MQSVNICGIKHDVIEVSADGLSNDTHLGSIDYGMAQIKINKDCCEEIKNATLCHEILHGMLVHIGRPDLSCDEQFVVALGNAINESFTIKK